MRNKKYNPHKNSHLVIQRSFRQSNLGILYVGGNAYCGLVNLKTGKSFNPTKSMCDALLNTQLHWTVINAVFLRESNGKHKAVMEELGAPVKCYQRQLANTLQIEHMRLYRETLAKAPKNVLNLGWLATPYDLDLDTHYEQVESVFELNDAYDCLAPWEVECETA